MPVLSICIPTYNRSGYLYFTLKSIVEQDFFKNTNDIEVVILDNCSTDLTENICKIFVDKFPSKIIYKQNEIADLSDKRFETILRMANGEVLKLHNDNFSFNEGSLETIVNKIKELRETKPTIFFSNGNSRVKKSVMCENLNELVSAASYLTTWIASFSIWKEDLDKFDDFSKNVHTYLIQSDVLFRMITSGKKIFVMDDFFFDGIGAMKKGGYNIAKVFGYNYLTLLNEYVGTALDKQIYEKEKKDLLLNHIIPMRFISAIKFGGLKFENDGYWKYLFKFYWYNHYFYTSVFGILYNIIETTINKMFRPLNPKSYQKYWRKRNRHNQLTIAKNIDDTKIFAGKNCDGQINASFSNNPNELLLIEDNVKIKDNVKFVFGDSNFIIVKNGIEIPENSVVKASIL